MRIPNLVEDKKKNKKPTHITKLLPSMATVGRSTPEKVLPLRSHTHSRREEFTHTMTIRLEEKPKVERSKGEDKTSNMPLN